jgi:CHAT domain-containing protein
MRVTLATALILATALSGCATPPPTAYLGGSAEAGSTGGVSIGRDAAGENCVQQSTGLAGHVDIFCGAYEQPSAHVRSGENAPLAELVTASPWRTALDTRFACNPPRPTTILGSEPAMLLECTRHIGGWPQVALVASVGGGTYYADGLLPTLPVMERAIGVLSGRVSAGSAAPTSGADSLLASRLASQAFSSGNIGQYEQLMLLGTRANLSGNFISAEKAYRAALTLQQKALGHDNPNTVSALMLLALNLSDEGSFAEADSVFAQADRLAPRASDQAAPARLLHYRALHAVNQQHYAAALALLDQAEAAYAALLPDGALTTQHAIVRPVLAGPGAGINDLPPGDELTIDPVHRDALIGVVEVRRYRAIVLRELHRPAESTAAIESAVSLAAAHGLRQPILTARLYRTAATTAGSQGEGDAALSGLTRSAADFSVALPGSQPVAETDLLHAAELHRQGSDPAAVALCRKGSALLRDLKVGVRPDLLKPCLDAFAAQAEHTQDRQPLLSDMFEMAQLAQAGVTAPQIALATARLAENARDPKVGEAIRRRQDAGVALADLYRRREAASQARPAEELEANPIPPAELEKRITAAQATLADADAVLQAASPNYGQLVQQVTSTKDVLAALTPDESFASVILASDGGWTFLLHHGEVSVGRSSVNAAQMAALVARLRASIEPTSSALPRFDTDAAQRIYAALFGGLDARMQDTGSLIVAPIGPLLSVPFGVLLTGAGDPAHLGDAPWLIKRMAVSHVPAAANFVALRRLPGSPATTPWFGLGDFRPATLAQAQRTFPAACAESARLYASLPPLPFAKAELEAARRLLGGSTADELVGAAFTVPAIQRADLQNVRVLHFAAHALLPQELRCESEPAIVTSAPPGAPDASGTLLTASDVTALKLNADAVILSACNSGGAGGGTAGESLSGLARSFFYAGARALIVTHWSVNDQAAAFLVADTLRRVRGGKDGGLAGSLRGAELGMIAGAGHSMPADLSHPFYWAPFALIGEGRGRSMIAGL